MNIHTIYLKDLIFSGIHGITPKEREKPQRLKFDIELKTSLSPTFNSDDISKTIDYRFVREIIRRVAEEESYSLIETIGEEIAHSILADRRISSVSVSVTKPDIWRVGSPTVTIFRENLSRHVDLINFDVNHIVEKLCFYGAVSFPILPESRRKKLLKEAEGYSYQKQPEIVGPAKVREQLSSYGDFKDEESLFWKLRDDFTELLLRKEFMVKGRLFYPSLYFNEMSLQLYKKGSIGITPHKDGLSRVNLVCIFVLKGEADFALCEDRAGSNPRHLNASPGSVVLLRAPGFLGRRYRPFHLVTNVKEERLVFGLRQKAN